MNDVILSERDPERFRGPKERESLFGVGSGVVSEESAFPRSTQYRHTYLRIPLLCILPPTCGRMRLPLSHRM